MKRVAIVQARGKRRQTEVAKDLGVPQQTYSNWERGYTTPSVPQMIKIEEYFGVKKELLFCDVFNSKSEFRIKNNTKAC